MIWLTVISIKILVGDIFAKILQKKLALSESRERSLVTQYFFCALISWVTFLFWGGYFSHIAFPLFLIIGGISLLNGFACYCQWQSQAISMSKSAVMGIPDDIIALTLIYLLAPQLEIPFLNKGLIVGVMFCFMATIIFALQGSDFLKHRGANLVGWVLGYTIIWGVATFLFRLFSGGIELPWHNFMLIWYNGSLISALIIFTIAKARGKLGPKMTSKEQGNAFVLSLLVCSAFVLLYIALKFGTLTATKPIFLVSAMVGPTLVGFIVFKEHRSLKTKSLFTIKGLVITIETIAYVLGIIGTIIIAISFSSP